MGKQHGFSLCILVLMLASVLHPGLKLEYFRQQDWEDEWIDNVTDLVHEVYVSHYEGKEDSAVPISAAIANPVSLQPHLPFPY
jgi:hypothetical protein